MLLASEEPLSQSPKSTSMLNDYVPFQTVNNEKKFVCFLLCSQRYSDMSLHSDLLSFTFTGPHPVVRTLGRGRGWQWSHSLEVVYVWMQCRHACFHLAGNVYPVGCVYLSRSINKSMLDRLFVYGVCTNPEWVKPAIGNQLPSTSGLGWCVCTKHWYLFFTASQGNLNEFSFWEVYG